MLCFTPEMDNFDLLQSIHQTIKCVVGKPASHSVQYRVVFPIEADIEDVVHEEVFTELWNTVWYRLLMKDRMNA